MRRYFRHGMAAYLLGMLAMCTVLALAGCGPTGPNPKPTVSPSYVQHEQVGDGSWRVGIDIPAGTWKTSSANADVCVWWVTDLDESRFLRRSDIPATGAAPTVIQLNLDPQTEVFHTVGCGTWTHARGSK